MARNDTSKETTPLLNLAPQTITTTTPKLAHIRRYILPSVDVHPLYLFRRIYNETRPLILVAHSLGGLVVKRVSDFQIRSQRRSRTHSGLFNPQFPRIESMPPSPASSSNLVCLVHIGDEFQALCNIHRDRRSGLSNRRIKEQNAVYDSISGLVFMGTPHAGSHVADAARTKVLKAIARATFKKPPEKLVTALSAHSSELYDLSQSFENTTTLTQGIIEICTYFETKTQKFAGGEVWWSQPDLCSSAFV